MSSYNLDKGYRGFMDVLKPALEELSREAPDRHALLVAFQETYKNKVGVMPEFVTEGEGEDEVSIEVVFAGKRLGEAALKCVTEINETNMPWEDFNKLVFEKYAQLKKVPQLNRSAEVDPAYQKLQDELAEEIRKNKPINLVEVSEDASHTPLIEDVDLLRDIPVSELDTEGLRQRGLLPVDFNSLVGNANKFMQDNPDYGMEESKPQGLIVHEENTEEWKVCCPQCKTDKVAMGASFNEFVCLLCDLEFECTLGLGDVWETEEDAEGMLGKFFGTMEG